jgi:outer membrane protein OmpA-like peptidoglycan-associated protein
VLVEQYTIVDIPPRFRYIQQVYIVVFKGRISMKKYLATSVLLVGLAISPSLFAHGKLININIGGGGAYPLGSELTKLQLMSSDPTATIDQKCPTNSTNCNPAFFGAGAGGGLDVSLPKAHLGIGVHMTFYAFLRKEDPSGNTQVKDPFNNITIFVPQLNFRLLDVVPSYNKKWGTLIIGAAPGIGWLYNVVNIAMKIELAYLYPVYNIDKFAVQVGLGAGFAWQHPFQEGLGDDMYIDFGLRLSFGILPEKGVKKKALGEEEAAMGAAVSDEMKKKDTDGDGLSDYCELMLGTNSKSKDSDDDGLFDSEEDKNRNCMRDEGETDPAVADTDGGGAPDGWEIKNGYDPLNPDDDDKDQDFVIDNVDSCLNTPKGIAVNERGCPTLVEPTVLEGVTFVEGTAELTPEGQDAIDNWVAVLQDNPELKFQIVGYTDSKGNKKKLVQLSKDRAKAVFEIFSSKGISEPRMTYEGKGPADPIQDNKTAEGRAANNRIVLIPIFE